MEPALLLPNVPTTPASIRRTPRSGAPYVHVLDLNLLVPLGILFQPEQSNIVFNQQGGGSVVKRHCCFARWPDGVTDPMPVHGGDMLVVPMAAPAGAAVISPPTPTAASFAVAGGAARAFTQYQPITVGGVTARFAFASLAQYANQPDIMQLDAPLAAPPPVGAAVLQTEQHFVIDDAECWAGHHIEIYLRLVPHNA